LRCTFLTAGECSTLEKQLAEVQASEAGLTKAKAALQTKLAELEELLATTTTRRDELTGGHCDLQQGKQHNAFPAHSVLCSQLVLAMAD
jgi:peptidoglycan hydrolase CwlO-like protein